MADGFRENPAACIASADFQTDRALTGSGEKHIFVQTRGKQSRHARNFLRHEILTRCAAGPYPAATAALVRLGGQVGRLATALRSAADHLLETRGRRHADGSFLLLTDGLGGLDRHLLAEVFVALWERQGWPRRDMTAGHYARLAEMAVEAAPLRVRSDLPGGIRVVAERAGAILLVPPGQ